MTTNNGENMSDQSSETIEVTGLVPATPDAIYAAWLDPEGHALMTGAAASGDCAVGGSYRAWDGYITASTLEVEPGQRFVQAWRTAVFPDEAPDSRVEVRLAAKDGGTRVTIAHSVIPAGQGGSYQQGWVDHYLDPMSAYFRGL